MKKTFRFLSMAALLVVGAIMTGCSSDDNIDNLQQPESTDNIVTLTATVSLDEGSKTRAIDLSDGTKTFEVGKQIAVIYKNTDDETVKAVSTDFTPTGDNTKATFTVELTNPANNSAIRYIYPSTMAKEVATTATITDDAATIDYTGLLGSQDGTLATLADYDLAVKDATLSGTDQPTSVTLENPLAVCAFTLTDGTDPITSDVKSLTISDGTNTYAVTPSSQSPIYVAMKPVASSKIAFTAATDSKTYFKTATGTSLAASTLYTSITVGMQELAVGSVICSDGSVYASKSAAESASKTPVAKIAYLGSDNGEAAPYNHGLALALSDVSSSTYTWCSQNIETCLGTGHQFESEAGAKGDLAGIANTDALVNNAPAGHTHAAASAARNYNSGTHPTGTSAWFLPSAGQWDKMATAAGGYGTLRTNAGLQLSLYWSSSEVNASFAWSLYFIDGTWRYNGKGNDYLVRACLAF